MVFNACLMVTLTCVVTQATDPTGEYVPAGQAVQDSLSVEGVVFAGQIVATPPVQRCPSGHGRAVCDPGFEYWPDGTGLQEVAPGLETCPAGQIVQDVAPPVE